MTLRDALGPPHRPNSATISARRASCKSGPSSWCSSVMPVKITRKGVAARARGLAPVLGADADLLEAAAWLHDTGYAPDLATTGLHQLDGARYLRDAQHADAMLCRLVAHHSRAIAEAGERGLAHVLSSEFDPAPYALASVLTCCDMTTSPDGEPVPVEQRLAEIGDRYSPGHLVSRSIQRATPMILRAVEQVHHRAAQTTQPRKSEAGRCPAWLYVA